jgi:quinol monooxygenase YgiN
MINVVVTLDVEPGHLERLLRAMEVNVRASRLEPGCVQFDVSHASEANRIVMFETYVDRAAFDLHRRSDHCTAWFEASREGVRAREASVGELLWPDAWR